MSAENGPFGPKGLLVAYWQLGTISIDELRDALVEDLHVLKELYNVRYVKGSKLKITVTNEYGEELKVRRPGGGRMYFMHTHHYRPACKDYEL